MFVELLSCFSQRRALDVDEDGLQLGRLMSEDPEEEERQRQYKSLLNKLTPEKYETILDKMMTIEVTQPLTLYGLIDQVSHAG